jgi:transposase
VAKTANVSSTTATRIFDHIKYSNKSLPRVVSMDEFKGNAGGEKFQCIITDPEHKKVLDILPIAISFYFVLPQQLTQNLS